MTLNNTGNAGSRRGLIDVSELGLVCKNPECEQHITHLPFWPQRMTPLTCMDCKTAQANSVHSTAWEMGVIKFEGKTYELPMLYLSDGTPVIPGHHDFKPDLGPFPPLRIRRGAIKGLKIAYATLHRTSDAPSQMVRSKSGQLYANLVYRERELMDRTRAIMALTDDLLEVTLHADYVGKVTLGKNYYCFLKNRGRLIGHPESLQGSEMVLNGAEARAEEDRRLGPTGIWYHRIICKWPEGRPLPEDKKDEKHPMLVSPAEVIDCFEHISACSRMEVTIESTTDEINKAYRVATKRFGEGRVNAAFKDANVDVDPAVATRNNTRLHELKMACEKAKKARALAIEAEVNEFVEFSIRAGKTQQYVIESLVKKLISEIGDLKVFIYDSRVTIPKDREDALNFVANHIVVEMAKDIAGVIADESKAGRESFMAHGPSDQR